MNEKCYALNNKGDCVALSGKKDCICCSFYKTMGQHKADIQKANIRIHKVMTRQQIVALDRYSDFNGYYARKQNKLKKGEIK